MVVLTRRNSFEMIGPHASCHLAKVIYFVAFWNRTNEVLITPAMSVDVSAVPIGDPSRIIEARVSAQSRGQPKPTSIGDLHLPPKSDFN